MKPSVDSKTKGKTKAAENDLKVQYSRGCSQGLYCGSMRDECVSRIEFVLWYGREGEGA